MSSRAALAVLVGIAVAGVLSALAVAAGDRPRLAFTTNVRALEPAGYAAPGDELCQRRVDAVEPFDEVQLKYWTFGKPGPRLRVTVSRFGGRQLASGVLPMGYADNREAAARVSPRVPAGGPIDVCVRNEGATPVAAYGAPDYENLTSYAWLRKAGARSGRPRRTDLHVVFLNERGRSVLSQLPAVFRRASLLRPGWVGAWTFWALLAALVVGVPALFGRALLTAGRDPG